MRPRVVVAGFGNVLRGDDGFGVEVVRRLQESGEAPEGTIVMEVGTGGLALAQELLTPCDRLVIIDAMSRGGEPGSVYVLRVEDVEPPGAALQGGVIDMHMAVPSRALGLAKAMGTMPREVFLVGCEPSVVDDLTMELTEPVHRAVDSALAQVHTLLKRSDG